MGVEQFSPEYVTKLVEELRVNNPGAQNPNDYVVVTMNAEGERVEETMMTFAYRVREMELTGNARLSPYGGEIVYMRRDDTDTMDVVMLHPNKASAFWTAHYLAVKTMG